MDDLQPTQQLQRPAFAVALSDRPLSPHYPALIPAHSRQLTATGRLTCPHLTEHSPVFPPHCWLVICRSFVICKTAVLSFQFVSFTHLQIYDGIIFIRLLFWEPIYFLTVPFSFLFLLILLSLAQMVKKMWCGRINRVPSGKYKITSIMHFFIRPDYKHLNYISTIMVA